MNARCSCRIASRPSSWRSGSSGPSDPRVAAPTVVATPAPNAAPLCVKNMRRLVFLLLPDMRGSSGLQAQVLLDVELAGVPCARADHVQAEAIAPHVITEARIVH